MLQETVWVPSNTQRPLRYVREVLLQITEPATGGVLEKKVVLEISQNSQETTCAKVSFFNKVEGLFRTPPDDCFQSYY